MNENLKKGLLIGLVILAVIVAGWQISKTLGGDQVHVEATYKSDPGHKSEKQLALDAQAKSGSAPKTAAPDPKSEADRDAALAGG
jgi:hypothetical protein